MGREYLRILKLGWREDEYLEDFRTAARLFLLVPEAELTSFGGRNHALLSFCVDGAAEGLFGGGHDGAPRSRCSRKLKNDFFHRHLGDEIRNF